MKINLIIDGNYLLYRNVFILKNNTSIKADLEDYLLDDFSKLSKLLYFNKIYFTSDSSSSWRKSIYKEYKDRDKDSSINWGVVYSIYDRYKDKIKNHITTRSLESKGIEGDDFIAHTVRETNKLGESNMIVSSDIDINQTLDVDLNKKFINFQWNYKYSDDRVYMPENYQLLLDAVCSESSNDLFAPSDTNSSDVINFIETMLTKSKVITVKKEYAIFKKLVMGDSGDNVPGVIKLKAGKLDPDGTGIGEKGADVVYKYYKEVQSGPIDFSSDEFRTNLKDVIKYHKKIKHDEYDQHIIDNIKFNTEMMVLESRYMPLDVYKNMSEYYENEKSRIITTPFVDERKSKYGKAELTIPNTMKIMSELDTSFEMDKLFEL